MDVFDRVPQWLLEEKYNRIFSSVMSIIKFLFERLHKTELFFNKSYTFEHLLAILITFW